MTLTPFLESLTRDLIHYRHCKDLSDQHAYADFDFACIRDLGLTISFVALKDCTGLSNTEIFNLHTTFFDGVRDFPSFSNRSVMPNGLLCLMFPNGITGTQARLIQTSKISHGRKRGGVIYSWALDLKNTVIHTHRTMVSTFPPVFILESTVFPQKDYLLGFMERFYVDLNNESPKQLSDLDQDLFKLYELGLENLLKKLEKTHPRYWEALNYEHRLTEVISLVKNHGDKESLRHERSVIIGMLNSLCLELFETSFSALCK